MKFQFSTALTILSAALLLNAPQTSQSDDYTHFVRQIQMPEAAEYDMDVEQEGSRQSNLPINPNGARFELWTVKADPLTALSRTAHAAHLRTRAPQRCPHAASTSPHT